MIEWESDTMSNVIDDFGKKRKTAIVFGAMRSGYGIDQIADEAMTVGQLKEMLTDIDDDVMIVLSHDNGYTYGSLSFVADLREERDGEYGIEYESIEEMRLW